MNRSSFAAMKHTQSWKRFVLDWDLFVEISNHIINADSGVDKLALTVYVVASESVLKNLNDIVFLQAYAQHLSLASTGCLSLAKAQCVIVTTQK